MHIELNKIKFLRRLPNSGPFDVCEEVVVSDEGMAKTVDFYRNYINNNRFAQYYIEHGIDPALHMPRLVINGKTVFGSELDDYADCDGLYALVKEQIKLAGTPAGVSDEDMDLFCNWIYSSLLGFDARAKDIFSVARLYHSIDRWYKQFIEKVPMDVILRQQFDFSQAYCDAR